MQPPSAHPVVVIGAGISGLSAAYRLRQAGIAPLVLDARPRPGGVIETVRMAGCLVEGGPDSYLAQKPWATLLAKELGVGDELIGSNDHARKTFIVRGGHLVPMPDGLLMMVPTKVLPMAATRLLSWPTKIRMGLELLHRAPANGRNEDISVAQFFREHYGQEAVDYLAEPLLAGVYGGDPERMSAPSVLGRFVDLERQYGSLARGVLAERRKNAGKHPAGPIFRSLRDGMSSLVERLVAAIGPDQFRLGASVESLTRDDHGYRLRVSGEELHTQQVILALPAYAAGKLLTGIEPAAADLLSSIVYNSSATVALVYDKSQFSREPEGFGFLVPRRERQTMVAATYVQNKFPHRVPESKVLLRCFVGRRAEENPKLRDDAALIEAVREDLLRLTGLTAHPLEQRVFRWPRAMAQYEVGHAARIKEIQQRLAAIEGLHVAGNAYDGIGIPDCVRSGEAAAKSALATSTNA